jgi:AraC-like DNA-binding protein
VNANTYDPAMHQQLLYDNPLFCMRAIRYDDAKIHHVPSWHYHKEQEIVLVEKGKMKMCVDRDVYDLEEGDIVIIGSNQLHGPKRWEEERISQIVLQFHLEQYFDESTIQFLPYFSELHSPLSRFNTVVRNNPQALARIRDNIRHIHQEKKSLQKGSEFAMSNLLRDILLTLYRHDQSEAPRRELTDELKQLKPALDYIEANMSDKLAVEDVCRRVNLSYYYFCRTFKKVIGSSFIDYVNQRRILKAERLLITKDSSIGDIAESVGIPNISHFYELFRRHNDCSPKQFKEMMMQEDK